MKSRCNEPRVGRFSSSAPLSAVYAVVFLIWGISQLPQSVSRLLVTPPGMNGDVALAGAALSGILVLVGSFVLALETRR